MSIEQIEDPIERFVAFIEEREAIRIRRANGRPWPWTQNSILQQYRFTNIHREHDRVSQHYQHTIRKHYGENPYVLPATVLYRWFNRESTCDALFNQPDMYSNLTPFEHYMSTGDINDLIVCIDQLPTPHVTGAYIIQGKVGFSKGHGVLQYFHQWCQKPWEEMWKNWYQSPPMLCEMYEELNSEGLGSFMKGQLVADLKYIPFLQFVEDWWTWATPGPGSMKGLNIVRDRPMKTPWRQGEWLADLQLLNSQIAPKLEEIGIGALHNQDLQNCLCEFSKFTKVARGEGRPRQVFRHHGSNADADSNTESGQAGLEEAGDAS